MAVTLQSIPRKRINNIAPPGLAGISYPEKVSLVEEMAAQDPQVIFDTMRPIGDEFWNLIDGRRTVEDIAEALCMQFALELSLDLFIPIAQGLEEAEYIDFR